MLQVEITSPDGSQQLVQVPDDSVIGKARENEIRLNSWRVGKEHARLFKTPGGVLLEDMGAFGGVFVNEKRIETQHGPLAANDIIGVGPYKLRVMEIGDAGGVVQAASPTSRSTSAAYRNQNATEALQAARVATEKAQHEAQSARAAVPARPAAADAPADYPMVLAPVEGLKALEFEWRKRIHTHLLETMDLRRHDVSRMSDTQLRAETGGLVQEIIDLHDEEIPRELDRALLSKQVLDEAVGLGPLEELLADDSISEIMVNRFDQIYVERKGRLQRHPLTFTGDRAVQGVIERIVAPLGRRIDESSPMVDARLKDGSRVNAIIPPLALKGPTLTIRKFAKRKLTVEDLVEFDALSPEMAEFLQICVEARKNIIVSGGTGSGKTTLLNILSNFIPAGERIITVEDAAELQLHHEHLISLESRPANVEGKGAVHIRDLVKNTLRMRPDRIVVGECRGAEALDMLQAMNTGHEGSLTTLHANTPRDGLARLETMVLMAGMDLPLGAIREQITSAVDMVVQQTRFACGSRKVTSITELSGMESGKIQIQELFKFVNKGYGAGGDHGGNKVQGYFTGCGMVPTFYEELRAAGADLDMRIFDPVDAERPAGTLTQDGRA
ncbi:Flp pilus assembly complex ATPase component TadA [Massilia sp. Dwa41.01b]|uniref:ATPase, T2SS/T4P/T4SS family n=1 Tax=unclassified Massilia TaxID=2609279 RepID=UPI0016026ED8|nr:MULTISPECIES: ATPase, T2SS/T4P/T4SS family [unclassified Massilia]QNA88722.1 Flp pilus assembly complex ATPase component TadA [Massilia sp. Dwa41.01b]QNA99621.1 Flp pilus assembly complex ATPase component TadA [Massilia sp. Se16.2.3]